MKDLGKLHYIPGLSVVQDEKNGCEWLNQRQYVQTMLVKFGMTECKAVATPSDVNVKLQKDNGVSTQVDRSLYQSLVGSLLYATMGTTPDIAYTVGAISKYCDQPNTAHFTATKRILRYLKGTVDLSLKFEKVPGDVITGYSDADFAGDLDDGKSTSGTIFIHSSRSSCKLD
ncbi:uncharacterized protein LOC143236440 [Tachypleus tridentatus]|uniref:uncharacterized protein LOC143236440 n=1 Tax=Tachypleus tridentatus TaxID=6853 RepID=UPI003FD306FA